MPKRDKAGHGGEHGEARGAAAAEQIAEETEHEEEAMPDSAERERDRQQYPCREVGDDAAGNGGTISGTARQRRSASAVSSLLA
jgi:hypothetical protein